MLGQHRLQLVLLNHTKRKQKSLATGQAIIQRGVVIECLPQTA
jgi:hypothetical protein